MKSDRSSSAADEWKQGWKLVLTCFIGFSFLSVMTNSINMFMEPVTADLGWSRTFFSSGIAIASIVTACISPFFGILVDRFGSRRLALPGILLTVGAICSFATATGSATQWIILWLIYAVISISVKTTIWTRAVAGRFNAAQGLALGFALCGSAASATILPLLSNWLIGHFGWRLAYVWLACGWGGLTLLFSWLFLYDDHDRHKAQRTEASPKSMPTAPGLHLTDALRSGALWRIALSTLVMLTLTVGFSVHQIAILGEIGIPRLQAAWLATLAGAFGIAGQLLTGLLLDRFRPNRIGALTMFAMAMALGLMLTQGASGWIIVLAMVVNGYTQGTKIQIAGYLTARYCGMRNFGKVYGFMNSLMALGTAIGPVLAAYIFDTSGSYGSFLIAGVGGSLLCAVLLFTLPPYPIWQPATANEGE